MDWNALRSCGKPILLYGMGNGGDRVFEQLEAYGITASGVFASDEFVRGQLFHGYRVMTYREAKETFGSMVVLLAFGSGLPSVLERIEQIAAEQELYAPDFPVVPGPLFTPEFENLHRAELDTVRSLLADDLSRFVFDSVLEYKRTGDIRLLRRCETVPDETYSSFLRLQPGDILMDLGAYRGDTILDFVRRCPEYGGIYGFEPDPYTFRKLQAATESLRNCELTPCAVSDRPGTVLFDKKGGRNSAVGKQGRPIPADSVDHFLAGRSATFFNVDVEGQEAAAIAGAADTIRNCRPKLLIAAYHRNEDLFALPLQVLSLRPDYRLYMRHFPQLPAWDVNYYFV